LRIGFLFHNRAYKLWHAAPIAFELTQLNAEIEVVIFCADQSVLDMAQHIASGYPGHRCTMQILQLPAYVRGLKRLLKSLCAHGKGALLRCNARSFSSLDALVVPDLTCLKLTKKMMPDLRMILSKHGAGDRAQALDPRMAQVDFVLVPGPKLERRFKAAQLVREGGYAVIGYVKFDAVGNVAPNARAIFDNDRPVVFYNPHFEPSLSSWKPWGLEVLDFFSRNADRYNLIFAPHVKLFERWLCCGGHLPRRFWQCANIHIDLGSPASENMSYTRAADIYLGDVSSQVYEYIQKPRPCLFLDPRGIDYWENDPNYANWHLGPVLGDIGDLGAALAQAAATHDRYKPVQEQAFADTFELNDTPCAVRAARAIQEFLFACGLDTAGSRSLTAISGGQALTQLQNIGPAYAVQPLR
jgi:hypothetical protein